MFDAELQFLEEQLKGVISMLYDLKCCANCSQFWLSENKCFRTNNTVNSNQYCDEWKWDRIEQNERKI